MRLKRVFLVAATVLAAIFFLDACSSDSGSSANAINIQGLWSIYEPELDQEGNPTGYSLALAYNSGLNNKPQNDGALKNQFLQLTSSLQFEGTCPNCGQEAGGVRLYGRFLSINNQFTCTPDLGNSRPLPFSKWMTFYGRLEGNQIKEATITGSIQNATCQTAQNAPPRGPDNCAADEDIFPATFSFPVEVQVSGEVVWEDAQSPFVPGIGYCKMVIDYKKSLLPDSTNGDLPSAELAEFCETSGSFTLYRSVFKSTDPDSSNPPPPPDPPLPVCDVPNPPPLCPKLYAGSCGSQPSAQCQVEDPPSWCQSYPPEEFWRYHDIPPYAAEGATDFPQWSDAGICGERDAFRFARELMYEEECVSTRFVE
ncbi:MAG: hypothetical protein VX252_08635 [Myxococcota bacterium]|nr:hypothetical protein [Myxococcota bacterium]